MKLPARDMPRLVSGWGLFTLLWLVLAAFLTQSIYLDMERTEKFERERLLGQSRVVTQLIDQELLAMRDVLGDLATDWTSHEGRIDINRWLNALSSGMPGVRTLAILNARGTIVASNRAELLGQNFAHREYFQTVRQRHAEGILSVAPPFNTILGSYVINVSRAFHDKNGGFLGVISASLDQAFFRHMMAAVLYAPDMRISVVHQNGEAFIITPGGGAFEGRNIAQGDSFFLRHIQSGNAADVFTGRTAFTGVPRVVALCSTAPEGLPLDNKLVVIASRELTAVRAPVWAHARLYGTVFAILVFIASLTRLAWLRRLQEHEQERARAALALTNNQRILETITDNIPGMVAYWTTDLRCAFANAATLEWYGFTREQILGADMERTVGTEHYAQNVQHIQAALKGCPQRYQSTLTRPDGATLHAMEHYIPDFDGDRLRGFIVMSTDITELKSTQMKLETRVQELNVQASTDALTGIDNRRSFQEQAELEFFKSKDADQELSFLMLDIDHFKAVNDTYGHDAGDEVLRALTACCKDILRATDIFGRLGGEEFGILLPRNGLAKAAQVAERLRVAAMERPVPAGEKAVAFTVSIGVAQLSHEDASLEELMKRADLALYAAKQAGRNRVAQA